MSESKGRMRHRRHRSKTVLHLERISRPLAAPAGLATAVAGGVPHLGMPDPSDTRAAWLSGSFSLAVHGGLFGILAIFAWLHPEVVDQIIPVRIVRELPGSNEEPAPVSPKTLVPRRAAVAQNVSPRPLTQALRPSAAAVSAETLQMAQFDLQVAPTQLDRRTVSAQRVAVARSVQAPRASAHNLAVAAPMAIRQGDIRAPVVVPTGPARIDTSAPSALAPAFRDASVPVATEARSTASLATEQFSEGPPIGIAIATDVSDRFRTSGGGGTGGTGTAVGVVRCDESAFVQRYYLTIRDRTMSRWAVPEGTPDRATVVLRFRLDDSGSASDVDFVDAENKALGASAARALREASPFPPLDANTRCISDNELRAIFTVPEA